jgi:hypothetical protein
MALCCVPLYRDKTGTVSGYGEAERARASPAQMVLHEAGDEEIGVVVPPGAAASAEDRPSRRRLPATAA